MIFSFSVPEDNPSNRALIDWYNSYNANRSKKMERSRDFRDMFLGLLGGSVNVVTVENETVPEEQHSRPIISDIALQPVNLVVAPPEDEDLDSELDNLTFGG